MTRTQRLAEHIAGATSTWLSPRDDELIRSHLLDTLVSIIACRELGPSVAARRYVSM